MKRYESPVFSGIRFADPIFAGRIKSCIDRTIPSAVSKAVETGRIDAFDLEHYHGERHIYWDSDTAKILEGIAYALKLQPDEKLATLFKSWTEKIVSCQCSDGYLNSYFTAVKPEARWKKLSLAITNFSELIPFTMIIGENDSRATSDNIRWFFNLSSLKVREN